MSPSDFDSDTHITEIIPLALGIDINKSKTNSSTNGLKYIQPDTPPLQVATAVDPNETVGATAS